MRTSQINEQISPSVGQISHALEHAASVDYHLARLHSFAQFHQSVASMRQAIANYLAYRPRAQALHNIRARSLALRSVGAGDAGPCGNIPLPQDFSSAANDIIKKAPANIPLGNGVLSAGQIQDSVCNQMQALAQKTILGYAPTAKDAAAIVTVVNDAEQLGASLSNLLGDLNSSGGIDVTKVTVDVQAVVGSITAILIATGAVTAGTGAAIGAAVALFGAVVDEIASLLQKKPMCQDFNFFDSKGNTYGGRIERICVKGPIVSGPNDPSWRKFPTPNNPKDSIYPDYSGWFDLPHSDPRYGDLRLDKKVGYWYPSGLGSKLEIASDAKEAQYWRPIDLAFSDYRRFECEQAAVTLDYIENLGLNQEQKTAVYAFKAYFFEMWKKAAEYKLNGLDADWQMSLARAILNWNMAHELGASGPLKLYAAPYPPLSYTQQGSCQDVLSSSSIPIFLMMANDNYIPGRAITDLDPAGASEVSAGRGFISGKDSQGTYVLLHTGDVRGGSANKIQHLLGGIRLFPGGMGKGKAASQTGTLTKVAVGTAATAAVAAAGIGVYAWTHNMAYSYAASKAYNAVKQKVKRVFKRR
jgi:hypothetical protein